MVLARGQEHLQRELLVPPVHPKTALTAPPRSTVFVVAMHQHVAHWASTKGHTNKQRKPVELVEVVVVSGWVGGWVAVWGVGCGVWGGGGGGADQVLMTCLCRYDIAAHAPN